MSKARVLAYDIVSDGKLAVFGLERPRCIVSFVAVLSENTPETRAGEQLIASVAIGNAENGRLFLRIGERPEVLTVSEDILHALPLDSARVDFARIDRASGDSFMDGYLRSGFSSNVAPSKPRGIFTTSGL